MGRQLKCTKGHFYTIFLHVQCKTDLSRQKYNKILLQTRMQKLLKICKNFEYNKNKVIVYYKAKWKLFIMACLTMANNQLDLHIK